MTENPNTSENGNLESGIFSKEQAFETGFYNEKILQESIEASKKPMYAFCFEGAEDMAEFIKEAAGLGLLKGRRRLVINPPDLEFMEKLNSLIPDSCFVDIGLDIETIGTENQE